MNKFKKNIRLLTKLEVKSPNVIKGIQFEGLRVVGRPDAMAEAYYNQNIDEIMYVDVVASLYERRQIIETVAEASKKIFIPMTVGGGIRSIEDIQKALESGADKVTINTAAVANPNIIDQGSLKYGSQCILVSIEAKNRGGWWEVLTDNGRQSTGVSVVDWVKEVQDRGAGEILLTSIDKDGTRKGFDLNLYKSVSADIGVPLIACGGLGSLEHIQDLLEVARIDAICCGAALHFNVLSVSEIKQFIQSLGYWVRL